VPFFLLLAQVIVNLPQALLVDSMQKPSTRMNPEMYMVPSSCELHPVGGSAEVLSFHRLQIEQYSWYIMQDLCKLRTLAVYS
jgi:hypothetical protein